MTTTGTGRAGDPTVQVDDDMVEAHARAVFAVENTGPQMHTWDGCSEGARQSYRDEARLHLTALFAACEVHVQSHMWLVDGSRTGRRLILAYPLPDLPEPPAPEGLAELIRSRIGTPPPVPAFPDGDEEEPCTS